MKEIQLESKNIPHGDEPVQHEHTHQLGRAFGYLLTAAASIVLTVTYYVVTLVVLDRLARWIPSDYREPFFIFITLFVPGMCVLATIYYWRRRQKNSLRHLIVSMTTIVVFVVMVMYLFAVLSMGNRDKGIDSNIKASINNMRAAAEQYYDNNDRSYNELCNSEASRQLFAAARERGGVISCYDSVESYAVEARLVEAKGTYFCIDSLSNVELTAANSISEEDHACGEEILTVFPDDLYGIGVWTSTDYWATYANDLFSDRRSTTYTETSGIVFQPTDDDAARIEKARLLIGSGDPLVSINFISENGYLTAYSSTTGGYTIWGSEVPLKVIDSQNNVAEIYGNGSITITYAKDQ